MPCTQKAQMRYSASLCNAAEVGAVSMEDMKSRGCALLWLEYGMDWKQLVAEFSVQFSFIPFA